MSKKYKLTKTTKNIDGRTLYQIESLKGFAGVKKGDLGGFIEREENLSQEGTAWVYENGSIYDNAKVLDDAYVFGNAKVYDNASVFGAARVSGNAKVYENASVCGRSHVAQNSRVFGNICVFGHAWVGGSAKVYKSEVLLRSVYE